MLRGRAEVQGAFQGSRKGPFAPWPVIGSKWKMSFVHLFTDRAQVSVLNDQYLKSDVNWGGNIKRSPPVNLFVTAFQMVGQTGKFKALGEESTDR